MAPRIRPSDRSLDSIVRPVRSSDRPLASYHPIPPDLVVSHVDRMAPRIRPSDRPHDRMVRPVRSSDRPFQSCNPTHPTFRPHASIQWSNRSGHLIDHSIGWPNLFDSMIDRSIGWSFVFGRMNHRRSPSAERTARRFGRLGRRGEPLTH